MLRAFSYRDKTILPKIFSTYVRPHLEFAATSWSPWQRGDIDQLEQVQRSMVAAVSGLKGSTYEEKLEELSLQSLEHRRETLDLVQVFKIVGGFDKVQVEEFFTVQPEERPYRTRRHGEGLLLEQPRCRGAVRENFFSQRVVTKWNMLPAAIKMANTVAKFKACLKNRPSTSRS